MEPPRFTPPFAARAKRRTRYFFIVAVLVLVLIAGVAAIPAVFKNTGEPYKQDEHSLAREEIFSLLASAHERSIRRGDSKALLALYGSDSTLAVADGSNERSWSGIEEIRTAWLGSSRKGAIPAQTGSPSPQDFGGAGLLPPLREAVAALGPSEQELQKNGEGEYSVKVVAKSAERPVAEVVDELLFYPDGLIKEEKIAITRRELPPAEPVVQ